MFDISKPVFGNWFVDEELGSGAYGTVYRIKKSDFNKIYYSALKVIQIPQSESEIRGVISELGDKRSASEYYSSFVSDFAKEIELMSELKGMSNIVSIEDHDFIQNDDGIGWTILIKMEYLQPFFQYCENKELTQNEIVKLGIDICSALEVCEGKKIIHRDVKPENIFYSSNGNFKIGDFGVSREIEKTTGGLSKKGTYTYMAPEVYKGQPYNKTVDIYSLGIVLYKLLNNNRAPFMPGFPEPIKFSDRTNSLNCRMRGDSIPQLNNVDKKLNRIILKACSYNSTDRYQSAGILKKELELCLNNTIPEKKPKDKDDIKQKNKISKDLKSVRLRCFDHVIEFFPYTGTIEYWNCVDSSDTCIYPEEYFCKNKCKLSFRRSSKAYKKFLKFFNEFTLRDNECYDIPTIGFRLDYFMTIVLNDSSTVLYSNYYVLNNEIHHDVINPYFIELYKMLEVKCDFIDLKPIIKDPTEKGKTDDGSQTATDDGSQTATDDTDVDKTRGIADFFGEKNSIKNQKNKAQKETNDKAKKFEETANNKSPEDNKDEDIQQDTEAEDEKTVGMFGDFWDVIE